MGFRKGDLAIFDLDGTLIDLAIETTEFERCRSTWATELEFVGVTTRLRPLLPELQRLSDFPAAAALREKILKAFDSLEVRCSYRCLGDIGAVLAQCRERFHTLALVSHNSRAFWERLRNEQPWSKFFDIVLMRDDMKFYKPDPRACGVILEVLDSSDSKMECWVVGNSEVDHQLISNLRQRFPGSHFKGFLVSDKHSASKQGLEVEYIRSLNDLQRLL